MIEFRFVESIAGQKIPKYIGDSFQAKLKFEYKGVGGKYDIGIGFAPAASWFKPPGVAGHNDVTHFFAKTDDLPGVTDWTSHETIIKGKIPSDMTPNLKDVLKWIQVEGGPRDVGGNGYQKANWDDEVYFIETGISPSKLLLWGIAGVAGLGLIALLLAKKGGVKYGKS